MPDQDRRPSFEKSPPELVERFERLVARLGEVDRRKMFGYPALFVGGNLVTSLFGSSWMVRLPDDEREMLMAIPGARPFEPMPGRPMTGYAVLPTSVVEDDTALEVWVGRALAHGATLPPKR